MHISASGLFVLSDSELVTNTKYCRLNPMGVRKVMKRGMDISNYSNLLVEIQVLKSFPGGIKLNDEIQREQSDLIGSFRTKNPAARAKESAMPCPQLMETCWSEAFHGETP